MQGDAWRRGAFGHAAVTFTGGPSAVRWLSLDIPNDGQPAWEYVAPADMRPAVTVTVGPFARAQTTSLTARAVDAQGCQASTTVLVTVQP